jgi:hypothetical protein
MEGGLRWQEISERDVDFSQLLSVDEVDVVSPIHEHLL